MFNWFERGYFTMDLPIKRSIDRDYMTLRRAIEFFCGQVPFVKCQSEQVTKGPQKMQGGATGPPPMVSGGVHSVMGGAAAGMLPPQLLPPQLQQNQKSLWDMDPPSPQRPAPVAGQNQNQMADYQQKLKEWEAQKRQMEEQQRKLEEVKE